MRLATFNSTMWDHVAKLQGNQHTQKKASFCEGEKFHSEKNLDIKKARNFGKQEQNRFSFSNFPRYANCNWLSPLDIPGTLEKH